jgi:hypothetical protein
MAEAVGSGYLPSGVTRNLNPDGTWSFNQIEKINGKSADRPYDSTGSFGDSKIFSDSKYDYYTTFTNCSTLFRVTKLGETVVQIVTFSRARTPGLRPTWHQQLKTPDAVRQALQTEIPENSWRWIHCQGLHGPTLRAVAEGTGTMILFYDRQIFPP